MTENSEETGRPIVATTVEARDGELDLELRRKNMLWGWALLGVFVLLFGGTVGVAFIYLWLS
jgi:hypothetical protein